MAKPLQSIAIQAPAFYGLNTEDSPTSLNENYALVADNCVIDRFGRIGARKGWEYLNSVGEEVLSVSEFFRNDGTSEIITTTATKVYTGVETPVDITPVEYVPFAGSKYKGVTLNDKFYLFSRGAQILIYDGTVVTVIDPTGPDNTPHSNILISSYGRLWAASTELNRTTVYWSALLDGTNWVSGTSGSIDLANVWPKGGDEIKGLAAHNNSLIVFGRRQILIYEGANNPATMQLADTIVGTGCLSPSSVQNTGTDVLFLSDEGVKSLNRTIQEKSMPMRDISRNVRGELRAAFEVEEETIECVYHSEDAFYLLYLPTAALTYCFDTRTPLQDGSYRATKWEGFNPSAFCSAKGGRLFLGKPDGLAVYTGYTDNSAPYTFSYFSNYLDFGAPNNLKLLKNLKFTVIGGSGTNVVLNWGYDYSYSYKKRVFTLDEQILAEYGKAEYGLGEYNAGVLVNRPSVQGSGGGQIIQLGLQATINGEPLSLQRLTAQAIIGRII